MPFHRKRTSTLLLSTVTVRGPTCVFTFALIDFVAYNGYFDDNNILFSDVAATQRVECAPLIHAAVDF